MFVWTLYDGTWVGWDLGRMGKGGIQLGMNGCVYEGACCGVIGHFES